MSNTKNTETENSVEDAKPDEVQDSCVTPTPSTSANKSFIPASEDKNLSVDCPEEQCRSIDEEIIKFTPGDGGSGEEDDFECEFEDDDTLSSEAMVDDIELILMPEETMDVPEVQSPKLVRVRELTLDDSGHIIDDNDDDDDECNFRKLDASERSDRYSFGNNAQEIASQNEDEKTDDEGEGSVCGIDEVEGAVGFTKTSSVLNAGGCDEDDLSLASSTTSGRELKGTGKKYRRSYSTTTASVQTEILLLQDRHHQPVIYDYRNVGIGGFGINLGNRKGYINSSSSSSGKRLNWKSELTLLPSKIKIDDFRDVSYGGTIHLGTRLKSTPFNRDHRSHEDDQYSENCCAVAKFTSQDNVLSSSTQLLKPNSLYRTRNLSRNLNQLGSSETSFILPEAETLSPQFSRSYRIECPTKDYYLSNKSSGGNPGRTTQQDTGQADESIFERRNISKFLSKKTVRTFRSSLPDLSPGNGESSSNLQQQGNLARRRQSQQSYSSRLLRPSYSGNVSNQGLGSSSTLRKFRKKSSSDEETSSLIDESERCLRSSIDLLLMDELPPPGYDYPYLGHGSSSSKFGRKYCSQPLLTEGDYFTREPRNNGMGSPFLPRRMLDLRCSKYAKVILPDGQVSVVSILEIDEIRDTLKIMTNSNTTYILPFRKVVFAWRNSRR